MAPICPSNSNLEVNGARRSFLFASEVREPLGADSMAALHLIYLRPRVCTVAMDIISMIAIEMDLRFS